MVNLGDLVFSIIAEDKASATVGSVAQKVGAAGVAIGAGIGVVGAAATTLIDANRGMDASFATTAASMGVSDGAVKELARSLQSVDSPIAEVAATLDILARAGMTNIDSMGQTASAFDTLADATGQNADTLTEAMVPAFNALGIELADAPSKIDGLATMFRQSNVDLGDFSTMMTRMGPDLGKMGMGLTDVEAILMSFADKGITGRKATSELTDAINESDGDISKFYESLGITADELSGYKTGLETSTGAAEKFADAQNSSFGTVDKFAFKIETLKQGLGDVLKPFEGLASAAMLAGPAIAGASGAMTLLGDSTVQKMIPSLGKAVAGIAGAGGLAPALIALATGPVGIAIAAIVAIGAAILLLDQKFHFIGPTIEWFGDIFEGIGTFLGKTFGPIIDGVIGFIGELFGSMDSGKGPIEDILGLFKSLGEWVLAAGKALGDVLGPAILDVARWIGENLGPVIKAAIDVWKNFFGVIYEGWKVIVGLFTGKDTGADLFGAMSRLWDSIAVYIPTAWGFIQKAVVTAATLIWNWLSTDGLRLAGIAVGAIWTALTAAIPAAWELLKQAVITAAGLIWTWLSTEGLRLAGVAVMAIWTAITVTIPTAWDAIRQAVITAAIGVWNWLSTEGLRLAGEAVLSIWAAIAGAVAGAWTAIQSAVTGAFGTITGWLSSTGRDNAVSAIGAAWSAIAGAVPGAWEAIIAAVRAAAENAWQAAQDALNKILTFKIPDIVGAAQDAWDKAQRILDKKLSPPETPAPAAPTDVPNIDITKPVSITPADDITPGGKWVDGHYVGPGAGGYWDNGDWVPVLHDGGIYHAPGGAAEGPALLQSGERVLSRSQTNDFNSLAAAVRELVTTLKGGGGSQPVTINLQSDIPFVAQQVAQLNAAARYRAGIRSFQ
jgi:hypothetical protein